MDHCVLETCWELMQVCARLVEVILHYTIAFGKSAPRALLFFQVYPPWRWYEKQDGIRMVHNKESVAEFYNILLERPKVGEGPDILQDYYHISIIVVLCVDK